MAKKTLKKGKKLGSAKTLRGSCDIIVTNPIDTDNPQRVALTASTRP